MLIQSLVYPGFTTLDLIGALQPLSQIPNSNTEIVAERKGACASDCGAAIMAGATYETASAEPDVLLVPGAGTPSVDILVDDRTMDFLAQRGSRATWIVAVCTGSLLLGKAGLLDGYKAASHWAVIDTLEVFGAIPVHERVVIDRNRCTGGGVTAGVDIGLTVAGMIAGADIARLIELIIEYNPAPPFGCGHPTIADAETLKRARALTDVMLPVDRIHRIASA